MLFSLFENDVRIEILNNFQPEWKAEEIKVFCLVGGQTPPRDN